jgi:hypothetical protein
MLSESPPLVGNAISFTSATCPSVHAVQFATEPNSWSLLFEQAVATYAGMYASTPTSKSIVHALVRRLYGDRLRAFSRPQGSEVGFFFATASAPSSSAASAKAPVVNMAGALEAAGDDFLKPDNVPVAPGLTPCCIKKKKKKN